ncbi:unnamed protein product [Thlaspi arvense]|uniref:Uncharacterized protein n=1 Tax=Thlaspi arvense TaxID=13288 RepID=A0AAU9RUH0_THLAR|nr:unnamed protein product [Thlaspi arvense]
MLTSEHALFFLLKHRTLAEERLRDAKAELQLTQFSVARGYHAGVSCVANMPSENSCRRRLIARKSEVVTSLLRYGFPEPDKSGIGACPPLGHLLNGGYIFGLGALREFVLPCADASPNQPQPSEEAEMIANRLQELEAELKQGHEENLEIQKRREAMEKMLVSFANQNA